jgi:hypothetical protein
METRTFVFDPNSWGVGWVIVAESMTEALKILLEFLDAAHKKSGSFMYEELLEKWSIVDASNSATHPSDYTIKILNFGEVFEFEYA